MGWIPSSIGKPLLKKRDKALCFGEYGLSCTLKQAEVSSKDSHVIMQFRLLLVVVEVQKRLTKLNDLTSNGSILNIETHSLLMRMVSKGVKLQSSLQHVTVQFPLSLPPLQICIFQHFTGFGQNRHNAGEGGKRAVVMELFLFVGW